MDPSTVEKLEVKIEEAVAEVIVKMGLKKLPLASLTPHVPDDGEGCGRRLRSCC